MPCCLYIYTHRAVHMYSFRPINSNGKHKSSPSWNTARFYTHVYTWTTSLLQLGPVTPQYRSWSRLICVYKVKTLIFPQQSYTYIKSASSRHGWIVLRAGFPGRRIFWNVFPLHLGWLMWYSIFSRLFPVTYSAKCRTYGFHSNQHRNWRKTSIHAWCLCCTFLNKPYDH